LIQFVGHGKEDLFLCRLGFGAWLTGSGVLTTLFEENCDVKSYHKKLFLNLSAKEERS